MKHIAAFIIAFFITSTAVCAFPYEIGFVGAREDENVLSADESGITTLFPAADTMVDSSDADGDYSGEGALKSGDGAQTYLRFDEAYREEFLTDCLVENCKRSNDIGLGAFTLSTADPRIIFGNLNIPYSELGILEVRIKNTSKATTSIIFLNRPSDTAYSTGRCVKRSISAYDSEYKTYYFDLRNHPAFKDTDIISGIRFDFVEHAGESESGKKVHVDYVKLHRQKTPPVFSETMTDYIAENCTSSEGDGLGCFTLKTADPRIRFENQKILCGNFICTEVRLKNETSATKAAIYYKRNEDSAYAHLQRIEIPISPNDTEYRTYTIPLAGDPNLDYNDIITGVRLDFVQDASAQDVGKKVYIDYVKFQRKKSDSHKLYNGCKAELVLSAIGEHSDNFEVYGLTGDAKTSWDEMSSYNDLAENGTHLSEKILITAGSASSTIDVTDYVNSQSDGIYAFVITEGSDIYSSEKSTLFAPKLVFTPYASGNLVEAGETVDEVRIRKISEDAEDVILIFAVYDPDGKLKRVYISDAKTAGIPVGGIKAVSDLGFEIPEMKNGFEAKVFVWRSESLPIPLADICLLPASGDLSGEREESYSYDADIQKLTLLAGALDLDMIDSQPCDVSVESERNRLIQNIVQHFKSRENPEYFYDVKTKSTQLNKIKNNPVYEEYIKGVIAEADRVMGYRPVMWSGSVDFSNPDVWDYRVITPGYYNYGSMINRFEWLIPVAQAYWFTDDERYAGFAVDILKKWFEANVPESYEPVARGTGTQGLAWNDTLDIGIRLQNLCRIFQYIRCYEGFDAEVCVDFLCSVYEHSVILANQQKSGFFGGNWQTQECEGMVHSSLLFPEFKASDTWYKTAMDLMKIHTSYPATLDDGTYLEPTPGYFSNVRQNIFSIVALSKMNGVEVDSHLDSLLEKMFEWFMKLTLSDGDMPVPGDTSKVNQQNYLAFGAALYGRGDMKYVSGLSDLPGEFIWQVSGEMFDTFENLTAVKPHESHTLLADSQYLVMRDDWAKLGAGNSLFFDVNPVSKGHNHYDYLNIEAVFGGERLLTEAGHIGYANPMRPTYGVGAIGHNVALIDDGKKQNAWLTNPLPEITCSYFCDEYDYAEGKVVYPSDKTGDGYEWRRAVVYLRPDVFVISDAFVGSGTHSIKRLFHTSSQNQLELLANGAGAKISGRKEAMYVISSSESGLKVTDDDGLGEFDSKLRVALFDSSMEFPCRVASVVANGKNQTPVIEKQTNGSYKVKYGNDEWIVGFGSNIGKTEISVEKLH